jgi:hypothetical protein
MLQTMQNVIGGITPISVFTLRLNKWPIGIAASNIVMIPHGVVQPPWTALSHEQHRRPLCLTDCRVHRPFWLWPCCGRRAIARAG